MIQNFLKYIGIATIVGLFCASPHMVFGAECACEVNYYHHSGCSEGNSNFPFSETITFNASPHGQSVWDIVRQYLQPGYPAVCDETSNIMRQLFIGEFELRVDLQCSTGSSPLLLDKCYVISGYNGNEPIFRISDTASGQDLSDQSCIKRINGDILRGCNTNLPPTLTYDERRSGMFYIGDHNNCVFNTRNEDSALNIWYEVSCAAPSPSAQPSSPVQSSPPAENTNQNTYQPIPFSLPSTDSIRAGSSRSLPELIGKGIRLFTGIFGSIALIMVIYGGLQIMVARGQGDKVKQGAAIIVWASIGLVTMMLSYVLVQFVFGAIT